jgi:hypothetical protein
MSTHDEFVLYVNPEIKKFKNVRNMSDYLKVVSRDQRGIRDVDRPRRSNIIKRLRSWSRSDKLALAILIIGALALAATFLALLITAGMRIF